MRRSLSGASVVAAVLWCACNAGVIHDPQRDAAPDPDAVTDTDAVAGPDAALGDAGTGVDAALSDGAVGVDGSGIVDAGPDAAPGPPVNRFGIGLVGPGNTSQWDLTADLVGHGGHIKLIFPGIDLGTTGPDASWVTAVQQSYNRELVPVIRLGPHWGDRHIRNMSDDASRTTYTQLAQRYRQVVEGLPLRAGWPLYLEIHNEPNLCYEWECNANEAPAHAGTPAGWMHYSDIAHEYAYFLRDVADALHAIGDPRIQVLNGALAPGGAVTCECGGSGFSAGITALDFLAEMEAVVPAIWSQLDGWASHAYPAEGLGWGFFVAYANSMPGLLFFENELTAIGVSLPVFITETGWTTDAGAYGSRQDVADWTVAAYNNPWLTHADIAAVMPFMLQDSSWDAFAWVETNGNPYPVYTAIRAHRCSLSIPGNCP